MKKFGKGNENRIAQTTKKLSLLENCHRNNTKTIGEDEQRRLQAQSST